MKKASIPAALIGIHDRLQVRSTALVSYKSRRGKVGDDIKRLLSQRMEAVRKEAYKGGLSVGSRRRLLKALEMFGLVVEERYLINPYSGKRMCFHSSFVTLTIPIEITEAQEKEVVSKLLKGWLQMMNRGYGMKEYVWRAERTKEGRLHVHVVMDVPVHMKSVQNCWNKLLRKSGMLDRYALENGHYSAPSTHIKGVKSRKVIRKYMSKYMGKSEKSGKALVCKVWDCSLRVKSMEWPVIEWCKELVLELYREWQNYSDTFWGDSNWVFLSLEDLPPGSYIMDWHRKFFQDWLKTISRGNSVTCTAASCLL